MTTDHTREAIDLAEEVFQDEPTAAEIDLMSTVLSSDALAAHVAAAVAARDAEVERAYDECARRVKSMQTQRDEALARLAAGVTLADEWDEAGSTYSIPDDERTVPVSDLRARLAPVSGAVAKHEQEVRAVAWDEGVATTLNFARRERDGITLRLDQPNPYRADALTEGQADRG